MKKIVISVVFLLFLVFLIWFMASRSDESQVATSAETRNPLVDLVPKPVVRGEEDEAIEKDDEMTAFEKRIGRKFTDEEKRLKPPEIGWTGWGQFLDLHRQDSFSNGDVSFYGIVVTSDGEPLSGVELTAKIRTFIDSIAEKLVKQSSTVLKQIPLITDAEGRFSIVGENGTYLQIFDFTKEGYEVVGERKFWGGSFNPHVPHRHNPDPENPVVFTMKKVE